MKRSVQIRRFKFLAWPHAASIDSTVGKPLSPATFVALRIKLDNGRLTIPPVFRELLGGSDSVWVTNFILDKERVLVLCTPRERDQYETILKDQTDREIQLFRTFLIGGGEEVRIDRRGRIRIPLLLLKFVNRTPIPNALPPGEPRTVLLCRPETRPQTS